MRFYMLPGALDRLAHNLDVAEQLLDRAEQVKRRVRAPSRMELRMRSGVGRQGAFAQVVMRGPGAIASEFGSRNNPPGAHLRAAIRGLR